MNELTWDICSYTKGQIGWCPQAGLFVFYQGPNILSSELHYSALDEAGWWADSHVMKRSMDFHPSAVMFSGKLYCFHQGGGMDGRLWYSVFDGADWTAATQVGNVGISGGPNAVVCDFRNCP